jgi:hypothetical protein
VHDPVVTVERRFGAVSIRRLAICDFVYDEKRKARGTHLNFEGKTDPSMRWILAFGDRLPG